MKNPGEASAEEGFVIQPMSTPDHEDLVAEVLYEGEFLLLVSQEAGFENMRVSIQPRVDGLPWDLTMTGLQAALTATSARLWDLRKRPS